MKPTLARLAAGAVMCSVVGCGPSAVEQQMSAAVAKADADAEKSRQEYEAFERQLNEDAIKCRNILEKMSIGSEELPLLQSNILRKLCYDEHINTTETAHTVHDQWVIEFKDSRNAYLYFENGKLVAKQL